jgi:hypothetical protein
MRAFDSDMIKLKEMIDKLMTDDPEEYGGEVRVMDDLEYKPIPFIDAGYKIPLQEPASKNTFQGTQGINFWDWQRTIKNSQSKPRSDNSNNNNVPRA